MNNAFPKAKDILPLLTPMVDGYGEQNSTISMDVNGDGQSDSVQVIYHGDYYEFKVDFNNADAFKGSKQTHSYFAPFTFFQNRLKLLGINARTFEGYDYLNQLAEKYPNAKLLLQNIDRTEFAQVTRAFAVLSKSETFRLEMENYLKSGGGFTFDAQAGYYYNPRQNTFNIPKSDVLLALLCIPHELYHRHDQTAEAHQLSENEFVTIKCENELRANIFAIKVLTEANVPINSETFENLSEMHQANQSGFETALKKQKRIINSYNMNYVEYAVSEYRKKKDGDKNLFYQLRKPYDQLGRWTNWFNDTYLQYYIRHPSEWDERNPPDVNGNLKQAYQEVPGFETYVRSNMKLWTAFINYNVQSFIPEDPQGVLAMQRSLFNQQTIYPVHQDFLKTAREQIRVENAKKFNLENYYH